MIIFSPVLYILVSPGRVPPRLKPIRRHPVETALLLEEAAGNRGLARAPVRPLT